MYIIIYNIGGNNMTLNTHEQFCFDTAVKFTAVRGMGAKRTRKDFTTFDDAKEYAATFGDKRTMIYAVNDLGNNAHITNA
jgi:hypothetical protein